MDTTKQQSLVQQTQEILSALGVTHPVSGGSMPSYTPITGETLAELSPISDHDAAKAIEAAHQAYLQWRVVPAPRRGELIRRFGDALREKIDLLGMLVSIEAGKIVSEGKGEVQEMIDICIFASGLSRQIGGLTLPSERASHRMMETWHPIGVTGIITAFNFPVAVYAWNAALALVCGNTVVWKPSEKTPLTALAVQAIFDQVTEQMPGLPKHLSTVLLGGRSTGEALVDHPRVPLISATGSTAMGRAIAPRVAARFGRSILELGGNNAAIITPTADLDLALRGIAFAAMGTAGQRCTTLRRLIVHDSVYDSLVAQLKRVYASVHIDDPRTPSTLVGPLIDQASFEAMQQTLDRVRAVGAIVTGGTRVHTDRYPNAYYVSPALVEVKEQTDDVRKETFAPILYVLRYNDWMEAMAMHNDVPQGLSSAVFTNNIKEAELFLSAEGSDCGIANINIGTSGAEIGGAFGGEKETGGGRESGSDAWKAYMRRATNTINYGSDLPLAQGVHFPID